MLPIDVAADRRVTLGTIVRAIDPQGRRATIRLAYLARPGSSTILQGLRWVRTFVTIHHRWDPSDGEGSPLVLDDETAVAEIVLRAERAMTTRY